MLRDRRGNLRVDPGTRIGEYVVGSVLAEGGLGTLFRAGARAEEWVLKAFRVDPDWNESQERECRGYFSSECAIHPQLKHPRIVEARAPLTHDGQLFLPTRFVPGGTLHARMGRHCAPAALGRSLRVVADISAALEYLARRNLVHRDVSPTNILIDVYGRALLADFGFVRAVGIADGAFREGASMSYGIGRWAYGAPELFDGRDALYDHRADIYSLGAVAIALLTGHPPRRWPPRRYRPDMPVVLADLLWAMVDDGPSGRPSWSEIMAVLESKKVGIPDHEDGRK